MLRCNVRGSSGYGKKFRHANIRTGAAAITATSWPASITSIAMGVADPERLGVMGWSYGGFMTSWIITQTKRFKAASVGAGVTNLISFTGTADIPASSPTISAASSGTTLRRCSARTRRCSTSKGVTTPTLIQHGENDVRVPISQGYELYNALKRQGVPGEDGRSTRASRTASRNRSCSSTPRARTSSGSTSTSKARRRRRLPRRAECFSPAR